MMALSLQVRSLIKTNTPSFDIQIFLFLFLFLPNRKKESFEKNR